MAADEQRGRGLGPTGETVRERIKEVRGRTPVTELSERLTELGRPIPPLGLRRIESGDRRVDVDDLVVIAQALGVSPVTLMVRNSPDREDPDAVTGVESELKAEDLWKWMRADSPLPDGETVTGRKQLAFIGVATPAWRATEYAEGVLALIEFDRLEEEIAAGGDRAKIAQKRMDELIAKHRRDRGDDQ